MARDSSALARAVLVCCAILATAVLLTSAATIKVDFEELNIDLSRYTAAAPPSASATAVAAPWGAPSTSAAPASQAQAPASSAVRTAAPTVQRADPAKAAAASNPPAGAKAGQPAAATVAAAKAGHPAAAAAKAGQPAAATVATAKAGQPAAATAAAAKAGQPAAASATLPQRNAPATTVVAKAGQPAAATVAAAKAGQPVAAAAKAGQPAAATVAAAKAGQPAAAAAKAGQPAAATVAAGKAGQPAAAATTVPQQRNAPATTKVPSNPPAGAKAGQPAAAATTVPQQRNAPASTAAAAKAGQPAAATAATAKAGQPAAASTTLPQRNAPATTAAAKAGQPASAAAKAGQPAAATVAAAKAGQPAAAATTAPQQRNVPAGTVAAAKAGQPAAATAAPAKAGQPAAATAAAAKVGQPATASTTVSQQRNASAATSAPSKAAAASPAVSPAVEKTVPEWLRPRGRPLRSLSVIVPSYNSSKYVLQTLRSVEASIRHFQATHPRAAQIPIEVIIVDDASPDSTAVKVAGFIEKRRTLGATNPKWKLLALQHNMGPGASRNIGAYSASGDVIFFCDSDDFFFQDHIYTCFDRLDKEVDSPSVTLRVEIDAKEVLPEWNGPITQTLMMSTCMLRTFFDFIEGLPEGKHWDVHEDVAFLQMRRFAANILGLKPVVDLSKTTTKYMRYPGNSLDRQIDTFKKSVASAPTTDDLERDHPYIRINELLADSHGSYLKNKKLPALSAGATWPEWDRFWSMYQFALRKQMAEQKQSYGEALRTAPLQTWRSALLRPLADALERRGNATSAVLLRDLLGTIPPVLPEDEFVVQMQQLISN